MAWVVRLLIVRIAMLLPNLVKTLVSIFLYLLYVFESLSKYTAKELKSF